MVSSIRLPFHGSTEGRSPLLRQVAAQLEDCLLDPLRQLLLQHSSMAGADALAAVTLLACMSLTSAMVGTALGSQAEGSSRLVAAASQQLSAVERLLQGSPAEALLHQGPSSQDGGSALCNIHHWLIMVSLDLAAVLACRGFMSVCAGGLPGAMSAPLHSTELHLVVRHIVRDCASVPAASAGIMLDRHRGALLPEGSEIARACSSQQLLRAAMQFHALAACFEACCGPIRGSSLSSGDAPRPGEGDDAFLCDLVELAFASEANGHLKLNVLASLWASIARRGDTHCPTDQGGGRFQDSPVLPAPAGPQLWCPEVLLMAMQNAVCDDLSGVRAQAWAGLSILISQDSSLRWSPWNKRLLQTAIGRLCGWGREAPACLSHATQGPSGISTACCLLSCHQGQPAAGQPLAALADLLPELLFVNTLLMQEHGPNGGTPSAAPPQQQPAWFKAQVRESLNSQSLLLVILEALTWPTPGLCACCHAMTSLCRGICLQLLDQGLMDSHLPRVKSTLQAHSGGGGRSVRAAPWRDERLAAAASPTGIEALLAQMPMVLLSSAIAGRSWGGGQPQHAMQKMASACAGCSDDDIFTAVTRREALQLC